MGLIKAIVGAVSGTAADQWKEYFYCDALECNVLVTKGQKRTSKRSSNSKGEDNIISDGSIIAVNEGQCMIIVEQGKVAEVCAIPGEFIYDNSTEPSLFVGSLGEAVKNTFLEIGKRFTFGGDTGKDQRVYYFNTKEILGNKYGTSNPVPFRVVDKNIGLDVDIAIRCNGEYSYEIENPLLFYTNVCGNIEEEFTRDKIDSMLKAELLTALQPAFARISEMGVRYSAIPGHTLELADALNQVLSQKWSKTRGIKVASVAVNSVTASKEDEDMIKELQKSAVMRDPSMAAAKLVEAQADAMRSAASNENGAMMGFMGMGMAQQAGGINTSELFAMGQQNSTRQTSVKNNQASDVWTCSCGTKNTGKFCTECASAKPNSNKEGEWTCSCGTKNTGKFCTECANPKPEDGWQCSCGIKNKGKFCMECGKPKPAGAPLYRCDKCGWEPEDPKNPPKFCPECGDRFDENDVQ